MKKLGLVALVAIVAGIASNANAQCCETVEFGPVTYIEYAATPIMWETTSIIEPAIVEYDELPMDWVTYHPAIVPVETQLMPQEVVWDNSPVFEYIFDPCTCVWTQVVLEPEAGILAASNETIVSDNLVVGDVVEGLESSYTNLSSSDDELSIPAPNSDTDDDFDDDDADGDDTGDDDSEDDNDDVDNLEVD